MSEHRKYRAIRMYGGSYCIAHKDQDLKLTKTMPKEEAEFIVLACNSHDALLEACEGARWLYDQRALGPLDTAAKYGPDYSPPTDEDCLKIRGQIEAAIAAAKKE